MRALKQGRILVDEVSAGDKQPLEQFIGHVGPREVHDVVLGWLFPSTCSCQGGLGLGSDGLQNTISNTAKLYRHPQAHNQVARAPFSSPAWQQQHLPRSWVSTAPKAGSGAIQHHSSFMAAGHWQLVKSFGELRAPS